MAADGDDVAGLIDGGIIDDLLDAVVGGGAESPAIGVDVADDVDFAGAAGGDVNVAGAGGDESITWPET